MDPKIAADHFQDAAKDYEKYGSELSSTISRHILENLLVKPFSSTSVVLDNAAGPGVTCIEILAVTPKHSLPQTIHATDLAEPMVEILKKKGHPEIEASVMDMQKLEFSDDQFTHSFCCFAIFAATDVTKAAQEIYRTLQPGGTAYVTTWLRLPWISVVDQAIHAIRPDEPVYSGILNPVWSTPEKLQDVLVSGGFDQDRVQVVQFDARAPPEFWQGNLVFCRSGLVAGQITKDWSAEEKEEFNRQLEVLVNARQTTEAGVEMPCWIGIATK